MEAKELLEQYEAGRRDFRQADLSDIKLIGVNLSDAKFYQGNFSRADLSKTDFTKAKFFDVVLDQANFTEANLSETTFCKCDGLRVNFSQANLKKTNILKTHFISANLNDADLSQANLVNSRFDMANFNRANLRESDLTQSQAIGTKFEGAKLTGACIQNWKINSITKLNNVICDYIYLKSNQQDRLPYDPNKNFAPGEFTKLFQKALETVDLVFLNGVDWKAFVYSFQNTQVENEGTPLVIQSIENKGNGTVVIKVSVPPDANKPKINGDFMQGYELAQKTLEGQFQARLDDKEKEINRLFYLINQSQDKLDEAHKLMAESKKEFNFNAPISNSNIAGGDQDNKQSFGIGHMSGGNNQDNVKIAGAINEISPEIMQLIRQEINKLDNPETRQEANKYLSDIEAEIQTPEPKQSRLQASLKALWNIGKDITLIANGITALAERFNVHL